MMKHKMVMALIVFVLFLTGCVPQTTPEESFEDAYRAAGAMPEERYTYLVEEWRGISDDSAMFWKIKLCADGEVVQEICMERDVYVSAIPSVDDMIMEADVDFDGQKDLLICKGHFGAQGTVAYDCYLTRGEELLFCPSFSEIPNPAVDEANQVIRGDVGFVVKRVAQTEHMC